MSDNNKNNPGLVSIVLPVLNEPALNDLLTQIRCELGSKEIPHEIIVVTSDKNKKDGFTPTFGSVKVFKSYGDSLERAILLGFSMAKGDKIIVMDADGSHPVSLLSTIIYWLNTYEMVVASRFVKHGHYKTTATRRFVSYVYTKIAQLLGSTLADPMSGYFGFHARLLDSMRFKPLKWKVALELNNKLRPKTLEIPYTFENRKVGHSKSSWRVGFKILWDILEAAL